MINKQPMAELITARDISERRESQKTLVENERRFRSYIEHSPIPVFIIDAEAMIRFVNNATARYLGYSVKSLIGTPYGNLKPEAEKDGLPVQMERLSKNRRLDGETRYLDSQGHEVIAMIRGTLLDDGSILIYAVDITERIQTEQKIRETDEKIRVMNTGLEEVVIKRTEELQQANNELEAFSYSVSHDLRAPLRHIAAFTRLIEQSTAIRNDIKLMDYFSKITGSVTKMNELIDSLLSFSRMGRTSITKENTDMTDMVKSILSEIESDISGRHIEFEVENLGSAGADKSLIYQVWVNLLSNAVKFTRNKEMALIKVGREEVHGKDAFYVRDNGAGFESGYKDKLFGVFQRLHSESEFEGTGIGLANVRRIVTRHGGEVWAEGETGKGATFYFTLP